MLDSGTIHNNPLFNKSEKSMNIDITIIIVYIIIINLIGLKFSKVKNVNDYFLGNRSIPWMLACFSIVATETSTLTFLSIPGLAYIKGMGFLQIALGYIIGRILVAILFLPEYLKGNLETVYHFLENCFGTSSRKIVSIIFHITRLLADSVRLFITSIPLTVMMGWDYRISILLIGIATFFYTYFGGIRSVVIVDSIQLFLYLACAFIGIYIVSDIMSLPVIDLFNKIPDSSLQIFSLGTENGWTGIFKSYNIFSGIIGGAFLSLASHGTDHLIVQRVLSCGTTNSAKKAMIYSGIIVFFQFALFMLFGLFIMLLLNNKPFDKSDEIVPFFIIEHLPAGLRGIMLAGILAAAMSTLSSSINSLSASSAIDLFRIDKLGKSEKSKLKISRMISLFWTVVIVMVSIIFSDTKNPLVEVGLGIASIAYGGMLGLFVMGRFIKKLNDTAALAGMIAGIASTTIIAIFTNVFWPWFVGIGFSISFVVGLSLNYIMQYTDKTKDSQLS